MNYFNGETEKGKKSFEAEQILEILILQDKMISLE